MSKNGKILVAMSGGVDSSVAAAYLRDLGYEIVGITMKTWDYASSGVKPTPGKEVGCCTIGSMNDARGVAAKMGFTHFVVDIREEFGDWVIKRFTGDYLQGRTPNPCVLCNTHIKWSALLERANDLDCEFIATGHYANVRFDDDLQRQVLYKGIDRNKDQTYALWGLPQEQLARSIFPLGQFTKPRIREMAQEYGLLRVANKKDSYEICFIPDNDYRGFLRRKEPDAIANIGKGLFKLKTGEVVGEHEGYPFYTIGQRRGLHVARGIPVYVTGIDPQTNTVYIGEKEELMGQHFTADQLNFIKYPNLNQELEVDAKIRYRDSGSPAFALQTAADELSIQFAAPQSAITPGQSVVLYEGDDVVAGGWIKTVSE
jgi:tRNA-uridine 2-sulfurtransferase